MPSSACKNNTFHSPNGRVTSASTSTLRTARCPAAGAVRDSESRSAHRPGCYGSRSPVFLFFNDTATTEIYTLSLHDALPISIWRANDASDRQGITEIKHVVGYLAYWDELRRRFPAMLIDTCASGGRRNDLETLRRAVPLWRSDFAYEPAAMQQMTYGMALWIPY